MLTHLPSPTKACSLLLAIFHYLSTRTHPKTGWLLLTLCICLLTQFSQAQDVLWGLTQKSGPQGGGTAFSLKSDGTDFTVRKSFFILGQWPNGSLTIGNDGFLYGMATL